MMCSGTASLPMSCSSAAAFKRLQFLRAQAHLLADFDRIDADAPQVLVGGVVLGLDGQSQRLDGAQVQAGHGLHVPSLVLQAGQIKLVRTVDQINDRQQHNEPCQCICRVKTLMIQATDAPTR